MPKTVEIAETDSIRLSNLLAFLKRGKCELQGEEVLAFAQSWHWAIGHLAKVKESLAAPEPEPAPVVEIPKKGRKCAV